jgi:CheY-like chemotaxis protein
MILFIDDEARLMDSHRQHLEFMLAEYKKELTYFSEVDPALKFFNESKDTLELVILDVMMPPGHSFEESNHGLKTGYFIYRAFRQMCPDLPILFYTNSNDELLAEKPRNDKNLKYLSKLNYPLLDDLWGEVKKELKLGER